MDDDDDAPATDPMEQAATAELERLLVSGGPLAPEELAEAFAQSVPELAAELTAGGQGDDLAERLLFLARQSDTAWRLPDGRLAAVLHHLRRATFTHRLTADEIERAALDLCPDLVALALPRAFALEDGVELRAAHASDDRRAATEGSLLGPAGWLADRSPGELLAVRYDGAQVRMAAHPADALDEPAGRAVTDELRRAYDELQGDHAPEVHRLVVDTIGRSPVSFAGAVAPVTELLGAAGLRAREAWVGPRDEPWPTPAEQARRRRLEELLIGADSCCQRAARAAFEGWQAWLAGAGTPPGGTARDREHVEHGPVAAALAEVAAVGRPLVGLRHLGAWAATISDETGAREPSPAVRYLRALGADANGDAPAAEAHLEAALRETPDHPACLGFLAELAQDRGDAPRSVTLLRQAGRPPGPDALRELEAFLPGRQPGRNEPCPCGSGRKYKQCCANRPVQRPLEERCRWLLGKATRHAVRTDPIAVRSLRQLFDSAIGAADPTALVADMLLFANRGLDRYLDNRGFLLPADELAAARSWRSRPLRLVSFDLEVDGATGAADVVDLRSGERLPLAEAELSARLAGELPSAGQAVLARPLPVGERWLLSPAAVPVPDTSVARALELVAGDVGPLQLLQLLVDVQVDAMSR